MRRDPGEPTVKFSDSGSASGRQAPGAFSRRHALLLLAIGAVAALAVDRTASAQSTDDERRQMEREGTRRLERREERRDRETEQRDRQRLDDGYRSQEQRRQDFLRRREQTLPEPQPPSQPPPQRH